MNLLKIRRPKRYYLEDYMQDIREEMENLFRGTFENLIPAERREEETRELVYRPPIELCEKNGNYELKAQFPGIKKEDIDVEVYEDSIKIKAETKEEKREEKEDLYRSEFRYGKFVRHIPLPSQVKSQDAKAEFRDGILTVTIPKAQIEEKEMKKLTVE